jgi:hypothetical protein
MTETPDKHSHSADALKALAENPHDGTEGSADGFVGPDEAEVLEDGTIEPVDGVPVDKAPIAFADAPAVSAGMPPLPAAAPDPHARRRRAEAFDQRTRKAHAHQYKTIMIPLLITMGVLLLLMAAYALFMATGTDVRPDPDGLAAAKPVEPSAAASFQRWFPFLAFPLGAILLVGAWWFHKDVNRNKA